MEQYKIDELKNLMKGVRDVEANTVTFGSFEVNLIIVKKDYDMIKFNKADLDKAFSQNAGIIAWIGSLAGKASKQAADYKTMRDFVKSSIADQIRTEEIAKTGKSPSEAKIDSEMRKHPQFIRVSSAEALALEVEKTIDALFNAARRRGSDLEYFAGKEASERFAKNSFSQKT